MEQERRRGSAFVLTVGLSALIAAIAILRHAPPPAEPAGSPLSQFSAGRAREILRRFVGDGAPHPVGSEANAEARERVIAELARVNYEPSVQEEFVCGRADTCATVHNIVARLPGRVAGKAVLLSAHYDSVGSGSGASDDGMGVAALLEIARIVKADPPPRNPIVFLIDDGEEAGLLGAEAFAAEHPWAREVGAVVNVDNRGTSGVSYLYETSDENRWLVDLASRALPRPVASSLFYAIYKRFPNDTDLTVFREHSMAGVNFACIGNVPYYHTPLDDFENSSAATLQHHGDNALAMARALAGEDLSLPRRGNAVFFDLFSLAIARWREEATAPAAAAALALLLLVVARLWHSSAASASALAWGLAGALAMTLAPAAAGFGAEKLLRGSGAIPAPWSAHPAGALSAFWALALFSSWSLASLLARRAGLPGLWSGVWILWAVFSVTLAVISPSVSFLVLVPAAVAALAGILAAVRPRSPAGQSAAAIAPACVAAFFWLPLAWLLYTAFGASGAAIAGMVGMWSAAAAPPFTLLPPGARRALLLTLLAIAAIGLTTAFASRHFSATVPERMPILWSEDADGGAARWLVFPESDSLPERMRDAARFARTSSPPYPWSGRSRAFIAEAPEGKLPAPEFLVREDYRDASRRRIRGTLRSSRHAPVVFLAFAPSTRVVSLTVGRKPLPPTAPGLLAWRGGWRVVSCRTTPSEGVEVEIVLAAEVPSELYAGDRSRGLPAGGELLARGRGATAVPSDEGDATVVTRRLSF
jgi:hypothetical protein